MKKHILNFVRRGFTACGIGPIVLAVIYLILRHCAAVETLTVYEVCVGIFSLTALAFVAGGLNFLYQLERLPLSLAILIHGSVLYISYLATYLINGWLDMGMTPILVFTGIFVTGYLGIWAIIYTVTRRNTAKVNTLLKQKQQSENL